MFNGVIRFHRGLLRMPWHWQLWLAALITVNMVIPLFWMHHVQAQLVLAAMFGAVAMMCWLTAVTGFSRLLGLAHILFWVPLLIWLGTMFSGFSATEPFGLWLRSVLLLNGISLVIDVADVVRYLLGEREETVTIPDR